jgi:hypothetical protein
MAYFTQQTAEEVFNGMLKKYGKAANAHRQYIIDSALSEEVNSAPTFGRAALILALMISDRLRAPSASD